MSNRLGTQLTRLVLDSSFETFEQLARRPNLFRIVGRTYTETWHSMFLAWLLDPKGSHGLSSFALRRLLLAASASQVPNANARAMARRIASFGMMDNATVLPNEREQKEKAINSATTAGKKGFLDIFAEGIFVDKAASQEAVLVVEQKVFAPVDDSQCDRYLGWLDSEFPGKVHIPILLAPSGAVTERLTENARWFVVDYQVLHDEVLAPVLSHPAVNPATRPLIEQYVDALRLPMNGVKLVISQEERELVQDLYEMHKDAFQSLFEVLTETVDDPQLKALVELNRSTDKEPLVVSVGEHRLIGSKVPTFLSNVIGFLENSGSLTSIVPFPTSKSRYLVSKSPVHPNGKAFFSPVTVPTQTGEKYYIEAHKSKQQAVSDALKLLSAAGYSPEL